MRRLTAVAAAALFLTGACGGGDETLSKEDFIEQADEICAELDSKVDEMEAPESPADLEASVEELEAITDEGIRGLRALSPPEEDADTIATMLDRIERTVRLLPDLAQAGKADDVDEMERLSAEIQSAANEASEIARDYGFERCGGEGVQPAEE